MEIEMAFGDMLEKIECVAIACLLEKEIEKAGETETSSYRLMDDDPKSDEVAL